jgi:hypothetical protein
VSVATGAMMGLDGGGFGVLGSSAVAAGFVSVSSPFVSVSPALRVGQQYCLNTLKA